MWSCTGGLRVLVERLTEQLAARPLAGIRIRSLQRSGDPARPVWRVQGEGQDAWEAEAVILTCPAYQQAKILGDLDAELAQPIDAIPYNRIAVVALGYRKSAIPGALDGFGFIAPQATKPRSPWRAVVLVDLPAARSRRIACSCAPCAAAGSAPRWWTGTRRSC